MPAAAEDPAGMKGVELHHLFGISEVLLKSYHQRSLGTGIMYSCPCTREKCHSA